MNVIVAEVTVELSDGRTLSAPLTYLYRLLPASWGRKLTQPTEV
jgi:hypothetical protein